MSAATRWAVVTVALAVTWLATRRLFTAAMRAADPARRAIGRGVVYDPFLARFGLAIALACAGVSVVDGAYAAAPRLPSILRDLAAATCVGWCALLIWADAVLARAFVTPGLAVPLLEGGPYAWVRHPRYLAWLGLLASVAVVADAPAGLVATACFAVLVLRRIAREEHFMRRTCGAAYRTYVAATYRLVPWVY